MKKQLSLIIFITIVRHLIIYTIRGYEVIDDFDECGNYTIGVMVFVTALTLFLFFGKREKEREICIIGVLFT